MPLLVECTGSTTWEQMHIGPRVVGRVSYFKSSKGFNHWNKAYWANSPGWNRNRVASTTINKIQPRGQTKSSHRPKASWTHRTEKISQGKGEGKSDSHSKLSLCLVRLTDSVTEPVTPRIPGYFSLLIHHVFDHIIGLKNNH